MNPCREQGEMRKNSTVAVLYFHKKVIQGKKSFLFLKKDEACVEAAFFLHKFRVGQKMRGMKT